jgi:multisubunit Na+/H+ antiporter MnhB subunit
VNNRSRKAGNRTVTPLTASSAAGLLIALLAILIGTYVIALVLTGRLAPEVGSAVGTIAAATIAAVALVVRRSASTPSNNDTASAPPLE